MNRVSASPKPSDGKPTPTQSPRISHRSGQSNSQTHEISTRLSSTSDFRDSHESPPSPLYDEPQSLSNSSNARGGSMLSAVHGMHTARTNKQGAVLTSYICSEESAFKAVKRIDEMAEVAQPIFSPSSTHHTSIVGACASESKSRGGVLQQASGTPGLVSRQRYNSNII